jgi:hypothetical protein
MVQTEPENLRQWAALDSETVWAETADPLLEDRYRYLVERMVSANDLDELVRYQIAAREVRYLREKPKAARAEIVKKEEHGRRSGVWTGVRRRWFRDDNDE